MRNLKKILALVLALVMTMSLFTVASADFADADEINNDEAVNILYALGVVNGVGGNKFNPSGKVTRAEMAKMITVISLGDVDVSAFKGTVTDLTDINGHWAEAYIKYCYSQGVISGKGAGLFAPNANVTSAEAAKMLLVAIGYNAKVQGYTGVGDMWSINVTRDAQLSKFYKKLAVPSDAELTREQAAQMIWNAVQAFIIEKRSGIDRVTGTITDNYIPSDSKTLLSETFGAAIKYGYLAGVSYDSTKKVYNTTIDNDGTIGTAIQAADDGLAYGYDTTLYPAADYSNLFGQKVAVVYKDAKTVYGIYSAAAILAEGTVGSIIDDDGTDLANADTSIKLGGTKITTDDAANVVNVYDFNAVGTYETLMNTLDDAAYNNVAAIDNDDDAKVDLFVTYPVSAVKVSYVGTASITAGSNPYTYNKDKAYYTYNSTNYTFPEGVAKNDYVLIPGYGVSGITREIVAVEKITGKVTATTSTKALINDTWYVINGQTAALGTTYNAWVVGEYLVATSAVSSASKDLLYVIAKADGNNLDKGRVDALFADGTRSVIEIYKIGDTATTDMSSLTPDTLYTYVKNSDGTYNLTDLSSTNKAGYATYDTVDKDNVTNEYIAASSGIPAKLVTKTIADDAVIFVKSGSTAKYTVIDGKTLKTYSSFATTADVEILCASNNGVETVKVATIITTSNYFDVSAIYGYVVSDPYNTIEGTTTYNNYDVWTVNGLLTVKDTNHDTSPVTDKGNVVTLTKNTNGTYTGALVVTDNVAVTGYSATDNIITLKKADGSTLGSADMTMKDAKVLYVDTKNKVGVEGGEIALAEASANGGYKANAIAYHSTTLKLLIVDTSNLLGGSELTAGYAVDAVADVDSFSGLDVTATNVKLVVTANKTKAVDGESVTYTVKAAKTSDGGNFKINAGEKIKFSLYGVDVELTGTATTGTTFADGETVCTITAAYNDGASDVLSLVDVDPAP